MIYDIATSIFGFIAFVSATLLGANSFTRGQRGKWPILRKLDGKQVHLLVSVLVFGALSYAVAIFNTDGTVLKSTAKELGVTEAALKSFFKILEQKEVPAEDLDSTLRTIAQRYKKFQEKLRSFHSDDPSVLSLKRQASKALEAGKFDQAEALLNKASKKDIKAARRLQETAKQRLLSAAASKAQNGDLKNIQLAYAEAAAYYRQAAELTPVDEQLTLAGYLGEQGRVSHDAGDYAGAQQPLERSLAILEKVLGPEHPVVAISVNNLASLYDAQGKYAEAEPFYRRSLAILEKALGPEHPNVAISLNNLAGIYRTHGKYSEAEPFFRRSLAILEKVLGPEHPDVAAILNNLAGLYRTHGKYAEAEPFYRRSLAIREKVLGPEHPDVAQSLNSLASLYHTQGKYAEAEPFYRRSLAIREKVLGPEHPDVAQSLNSLASLYHTQGKYAEAEPFYRRSLAILEKALGPKHPNVATILENYAALLREMNRGNEAASMETRATAIREKHVKANPRH